MRYNACDMTRSAEYELPVKVDRGAGPALVLLHGLGNNHQSWGYVLDALEAENYGDHRVIIPDLLGFGSAPKPKPAECGYDTEDHARAVIAMLERLDVSDAVLAGHSMGCLVASRVALERPDLVSRLVLLGPPLYKRIPRGSLWERIRHADGAYFTIFSVVSRNPKLTIKAAKLADKLSPLLQGMQVTRATWPAFTSSLRNTIMSTAPFLDVTRLTVPTLLVHGKLDIFVVKRNLRAAARRNRGQVRFISVAGPHEITPLQGKMVAEMLLRPKQARHLSLFSVVKKHFLAKREA